MADTSLEFCSKHEVTVINSCAQQTSPLVHIDFLDIDFMDVNYLSLQILPSSFTIRAHIFSLSFSFSEL